MFEPGQSWKTAALRTSICVHHFFMVMFMKRQFMLMAVEEAKKALESDNTPVGCVIVYKDKVIAKAYNQKNSNNNAIMHAEIISISKACKKLGTWRLNECDLYVTLEPCYMCYGAILEARIRNVYFLLNSNYYEMLNSNKNDLNLIKIKDTYLYKDILSGFFQKKR